MFIGIYLNMYGFTKYVASTNVGMTWDDHFQPASVIIRHVEQVLRNLKNRPVGQIDYG